MDAAEYRIEELGKGWRVCHFDRGTVGVVIHLGNRFEAKVDSGDDTRTVAYGNSVKLVAEQLIWFDRRINGEIE